MLRKSFQLKRSLSSWLGTAPRAAFPSSSESSVHTLTHQKANRDLAFSNRARRDLAQALPESVGSPASPSPGLQRELRLGEARA